MNKESERFKSQIRIDPRPMLGVFHATFVLSRLVRLYQKIARIQPQKEFIDELKTFRRQFEEGLEVVEKRSKFTKMGCT